MASTVAQIIARFRQIYSDCDATYAQTLFDEAHKTILQECEIRNTIVSIDLTANTDLYDLDSNIYRIMDAYYKRGTSPNTWVVLYETSIDTQDAKRRGWRMTASPALPYWYYITSAPDGDSAKPQIGFWPAPSETTVGVSPNNFPRVDLYCTVYAALSGSETVPTQLKNDKVYLDQMCYRWAYEEHEEDVPKWKKAMEESMAENIRHVKDLQYQAPDFEIVSPNINMGRVV